MATATKKKLRPGDIVNVQLGPTRWQAKIVEDRGPIGKDGRRLFRVQLLDDHTQEPRFIEVPADDIEQ